MNVYVSSLLVFLLVTGVMSVTTTSMAIECYNIYADFKKSKGDNYNFLVVNLISAIFMILMSFAMFFILRSQNRQN